MKIIHRKSVGLAITAYHAVWMKSKSNIECSAQNFSAINMSCFCTNVNRAEEGQTSEFITNKNCMKIPSVSFKKKRPQNHENDNFTAETSLLKSKHAWWIWNEQSLHASCEQMTGRIIQCRPHLISLPSLMSRQKQPHLPMPHAAGAWHDLLTGALQCNLLVCCSCRVTAMLLQPVERRIFRYLIF